jgi:hypothetical protein
MGWVWEEAAFLCSVRDQTWAECGKRLPTSSSALLETRHGLSMGRGFFYQRLDMG